MNTVKTLRTVILFLIASSVFYSCENNNDNNNNENKVAKIEVNLVDAPADYQKVLIDIQDVQVHIGGDENDESTWQSLDDLTPDVYDILQLTNGNEALLGEIELSEGRLSQIRLILGEENKLTVDGNDVDLSVPSSSTSGLKLNVGASIEAGITYKLIIDFDAAKSIVKTGSERYILKPVIRANMEAQAGTLEGVVSPSNIKSVVYAIIDSDSISTYPNEQGQYLIRALEEGNYKVVAIPDQDSGYTKVTMENVEVVVGRVSTLDTLKFVE